MEHDDLKDSLLDYLENTLALEQRTKLEEHLAECQECRDMYKQYCSIVNVEKAAASKPVNLKQDLSAEIMSAISELENKKDALPEMWNKSLRLVGALAGVNLLLTVVLVFMMHRFYSNAQPRTNISFDNAAYNQLYHNASFSNEQRLIPAGYRSVKMALYSTYGLSELLRDDALIDVKFSYQEEATKRELIIANTAKVLSVNILNSQPPSEEPKGRPSVSVNLLLPEKEAQRVELARLLGDLSLSVLVPETPQAGTGQPRQTVIYDPLGRQVTADAQLGSMAVIYEKDPKTGAQTRQVLVEGRWRDEKGIELTAF